MLRAKNFHVDPGRVVHETIDDETIIIDLDTGIYYSLRGSAPTIWALVMQGCPGTQIVEEMQRRHPGDARKVSDATTELIMRLLEEGLIAYSGRGAHPEGVTEHSPDPPEAFSEPLLEKYDDMEYFLLLDPIHEVEEGGWPSARAAGAPPATAG